MAGWKSIYEVFRACRLCGGDGGYKMPIVDLEDEMDMRHKIRECVRIEVHRDDKMPPLICELCVDKVNDYSDFLEMCQATDTGTRDRLGLPHIAFAQPGVCGTRDRLGLPQIAFAQPGNDGGDCILGVTETVYISDDSNDEEEPLSRQKNKLILGAKGKKPATPSPPTKKRKSSPIPVICITRTDFKELKTGVKELRVSVNGSRDSSSGSRQSRSSSTTRSSRSGRCSPSPPSSRSPSPPSIRAPSPPARRETRRDDSKEAVKKLKHEPDRKRHPAPPPPPAAAKRREDSKQRGVLKPQDERSLLREKAGPAGKHEKEREDPGEIAIRSTPPARAVSPVAPPPRAEKRRAASPPYSPPKRKAPEPYACQLCRQAFGEQDSLADHFREAHSPTFTPDKHFANKQCVPSTEVDDVQCAECWLYFATTPLLLQHRCRGEDGRPGGNNTSIKRPQASESQCKQSVVEATNGASSPNEISAENTSNVPAKNKAFVYPYLQRIPDYCKDSENGGENIVKKPCHISRELLNSMKQHLLKSSNQNQVMNTNHNTEISKVSEVDQNNPQVLPTEKVSEESSVSEPPQLLHGSQDSEIQPMTVDEPEGNEDTVEVSSARDDDSDRSSSPGVRTEETDQPVGHPTDRIRTQANFIARILKKMEESELSTSERVSEVHKTFELSIKLVKRIRNSLSSKKFELNKEKQDEAETPDVEMRNDVKSSSNGDEDDSEDEVKKAPKKPPNLRKFVLPPDYDLDDTRWTLKYRENDPKLGLEELVPGSEVFINSIRLAHCLRVSKDCKTLARMLLVEIFSQSALAVCSLTGAKANAFHNDGRYVRPGLDKNARVAMLTYVERHSRKEKWTTYDRQSVINSIRSRVQEIRSKYART